MNSQMITLDLGKYLALREAYIKLGWDLKFKTKQSISIKKLNALLNQKFKNKKDAFNFIHDLLEYNEENTLDICGMGDCPGIKNNGIADNSVGKWIVTWLTPDGVMQEPKRLCQDCKDYLASVNCLGDEIKREESNG
jgi:hypothetical protein